LKKPVLIIFLAILFIVLLPELSGAQCAICTKTAQQLGEGPAKGLNAGIIYLAAAPFLIGSFVYYRWKKSNE